MQVFIPNYIEDQGSTQIFQVFMAGIFLSLMFFFLCVYTFQEGESQNWLE